MFQSKIALLSIICSSLFSTTTAQDPLPQMSGDALTASSFSYVMHNGRGLVHDLLNSVSDALPLNLGKDTPTPPLGSDLVQFEPCQSTKATIPLFVSNQWNGSSTIKSAYITQHGASNDPDQYFSYLYPFVGQQSLLIAPGFYTTHSKKAPDGFYQPKINLAWANTGDQWPAGKDAVSPKASLKSNKRSSSARAERRESGPECSSFETYEALLSRLNNKDLYPNLSKVYLIGHSGGANMISRYSQLSNYNGHLDLRYIVINAANQAYFSDARPWKEFDEKTCKEAFQYPYQWTKSGSNMPRWVSARFDSLVSGVRSTNGKAKNLFKDWAVKDVVFLTGNADIETTGTQSCTSKAQGGPYRRDRNYAYWAYTNLLAGSNDSPYPIKTYFGYGNLTDSGAKRFSTGSANTFKHQSCIVNGVAHDEPGILRSPCGQAALFSDNLPDGTNPQDSPSGLSTLFDGFLNTP